MGKKLNQFFIEKVLCVIFNYTRGREGIRTRMHIQGELIARKFPKHQRGDVWRALRRLEAEGLIEKKGGTESYWLTDRGWRRALEVCSDSNE